MSAADWVYTERDCYRHPCGWAIRRNAHGWVLYTRAGSRGPFRLVDDAMELAHRLRTIPTEPKPIGTHAELVRVALREMQESDAEYMDLVRFVERTMRVSRTAALRAVTAASVVFAQKRAS